jgi:hypothetical protein
MFWRPTLLYLLNFVAKTVQVTEGRKYFLECRMVARAVFTDNTEGEGRVELPIL